VYTGQVYGGIIVGLAVQPVMGLVIGSISSVIGIADCAGALQAVLTVLMV